MITKLGQTRNIDGNLFGHHSSYWRKKDAIKKAKTVMDMGHLARVVPEDKYYSVYAQWQLK